VCWGGAAQVWRQQKGSYQRLHRCGGHSSTVTQLDWAADSSVLMSNDQSYEVLYWDADRGVKVEQSSHCSARPCLLVGAS
jgi:hypothetical protein